MVVTEINAHQTICSMVHDSKSDTINIISCKGCYCMHWRWYDPSEVAISYDSAGVVTTEKVTDRRGYCGKSGKPEYE